MPHRISFWTKLHNVFQKLWFFFLETLFPWFCLGCHKEVTNFPICSDCLSKIPIAYNFICPICGKNVLLSKTIINSKLTIEKVSNCSHHLSLTALGAATDYSNELVRELIFAFKYNKIVALKTPLSQLIISFLERTNWSTLLDLNWLVIPIPLHRRKYQLRGFNQSELLAQVVAQYFSLEISNKPLVRIKNNQAQASLKDKHSRLENAKGIFTISKPQIVHNRNILLIDDVITTGATMLEAAKILKGNKARQIIGLVLAKG